MSVRYRIYPSLLDKFQSFLDADQAVEEFWNLDADGEYKETADEMSDRLERELLDAVNRVPREASEAADKGTCFNEVVDCLISHRKCEYEGMDIRSEKRAETEVIIANLNGFEFVFDLDTCKDAAMYFQNAISQHYCSAMLPTKYGNVELYGYADEIKGDVVYDIKTTGRYEFGKYGKGWQRFAYPYCLVASGEMPSVSAFEYTAFMWSGGTKTNPVLRAKMYPEVYTYDHKSAERELRQICERFIEWLESHRSKITDKKIFAED